MDAEEFVPSGAESESDFADDIESEDETKNVATEGEPKDKPFMCDVPGCGKRYTRADHMRRHKLSHDGNKQFKCHYEGCTFAFYTKYHLSRHLKTHEVDKPHACTWEGCSARFVKKNQLKRHMSEHTNTLPYQCTEPGCTKAFNYPSKLKKHIQRMHSGELKHLCGHEGCSEAFATHNELRKHMKEHKKNECVTCEICGTVLKRKQYLKPHLKTHELDGQLIICTVKGCTHTCTGAHNMAIHMNSVHKDDRPVFACTFPECTKTFKKKSSLQKHITKIHTENNSNSNNTELNLLQSNSNIPEPQEESSQTSSKRPYQVEDFLEELPSAAKKRRQAQPARIDVCEFLGIVPTSVPKTVNAMNAMESEEATNNLVSTN